MARRKKPSGRLNKGPFAFADFERVLRAEGWERIRGKTNHPAWKHPTRTGKVNASTGWTGVKYHHETFASVASQMGITKRTLLRLLND